MLICTYFIGYLKSLQCVSLRDRRPRSIVAKFEHRKDRYRVLEVVKTGVLNETDFSVNEQYLMTINEEGRHYYQNFVKKKGKPIVHLSGMIYCMSMEFRGILHPMYPMIFNREMGRIQDL